MLFLFRLLEAVLLSIGFRSAIRHRPVGRGERETLEWKEE